jgi:hypothetical protein
MGNFMGGWNPQSQSSGGDYYNNQPMQIIDGASGSPDGKPLVQNSGRCFSIGHPQSQSTSQTNLHPSKKLGGDYYNNQPMQIINGASGSPGGKPLVQNSGSCFSIVGGGHPQSQSSSPTSQPNFRPSKQLGGSYYNNQPMQIIHGASGSPNGEPLVQNSDSCFSIDFNGK